MPQILLILPNLHLKLPNRMVSNDAIYIIKTLIYVCKIEDPKIVILAIIVRPGIELVRMSVGKQEQATNTKLLVGQTS